MPMNPGHCKFNINSGWCPNSGYPNPPHVSSTREQIRKYWAFQRKLNCPMSGILRPNNQYCLARAAIQMFEFARMRNPYIYPNSYIMYEDPRWHLAAFVKYYTPLYKCEICGALGPKKRIHYRGALTRYAWQRKEVNKHHLCKKCLKKMLGYLSQMADARDMRRHIREAEFQCRQLSKQRANCVGFSQRQ
jgi:hypothetical protein